MEQDLQRWREMGAHMQFQYPLKMSLVARPKKSITQATSNFTTRVVKSIAPNHAKLKNILDIATKEQKQDIGRVIQLSPSKFNNAFHKYKDMNQPRFGRRSEMDRRDKITNPTADNATSDKREPEQRDVFDMVTNGDLDMFTVLESFDPLKISQVSNGCNTAPKEAKSKAVTQTAGFFKLPNPNLSLTHKQKHQAFKVLDATIRSGGAGDIAEELMKELKTELQKLESTNSTVTDSTVDVNRLRVVSALFDKAIENFSQFGPLLSQIKSEYDKTLSLYTHSEAEFQFLLSKIQKLSALSTNRSLLQFEKAKVRELESEIEKIKGIRV
jgi:hypothetical protein